MYPEIDWDKVLKEITEKTRKDVPDIDWDDLLKEAITAIESHVEFAELVKHTRIKDNLSLSKLSKIIEIPEEELNAFEQGRDISDKNQLKIMLWFFEKEEQSIISEELKSTFRLLYLLCKLFLSENEEQIERFIDFVSSLPEIPEEGSEN